ncbi:MAG: hypothetical protein B7Y39_14820 [Bdellovibrio sp. 28-41-41]|nr:MAG: hypothetical protein B7Y39_14820 [Bdellovibrio sp. 28-41-41]
MCSKEISVNIQRTKFLIKPVITKNTKDAEIECGLNPLKKKTKEKNKPTVAIDGASRSLFLGARMIGK